MNLRCATIFSLAALIPTGLASTQRVLIGSTSPESVTERLKAHLLPQGFAFVRGDTKRVVLTLDRGMVAQVNDFDCKTHVSLFHVVMELQFCFKQKDTGLEVSASEVAVGSDSCGERFRRNMGPGVELERLQQLLDLIKRELEALTPQSDSVVKSDSTYR